MSLPPALRRYRRFLRLAAPILPAVLDHRARNGKEDGTRRHERLGRPSLPRPDGPLVWLHGASVGESLVLATLVDALAARHPHLRFLVTTGTVTSADLMARRLPDGAIHQYVPVDTLAAVTGFLDHWSPDLAVFAESELWPNLILETARRGTPMALVNARMNEKSLRNWARRPDSARWLLACFDWVGAADTRTCEGLEDLTGEPVPLAGNLKLEARPAPVDAATLAEARAAIGGRPVWLAASTHEGEDAVVLDAHRRLRETHPDALLILAPRHPDRGSAIAELAGAAGFAYVRRSQGEHASAGTAVWIADTLGEMALWYTLAPASLIAGSLRPGIGGHNPIEASQSGSAVIAGPHVASFDDLYAAYLAHDAILGAEDSLTLSEAVARIWRGEGPDRQAARAAIAAASGGALETTLAALDRLVPGAPDGDDA